MDEYLIIATKNHEERKWTRRTLSVAKNIADKAVKELGYTKAVVLPISNPTLGAPLYKVPSDNG